jgi:hypothetical protein
MSTIYQVAILSSVFLAGIGAPVEAAPQAQYQNHHAAAGVQASACEYPDQKADCEMYISGFTDTVNMVIVDGGSDQATKMLCGNTNTPDLIAEFEQEARKTPQADTDAVLIRLITTNHLCPKKAVQVYTPKSAGELIDLCHTGDTGFNLCSQYQWGFLDALFFMAEKTKTHVLCGDMRIVDSSIVMLNNELQADYRLRQKPAVWLMLGALQKQMPCPK